MTTYVYLAGPLTDTPAPYLAYVHRFGAMARTLSAMGCCPINPAGDLVEGLSNPEPLADECYKRRSMEQLQLLEYAQLAGHTCCVLVLARNRDDGTPSAGVAAEIAFAVERDIPVVGSVEEVVALRGTA